ncbi:MAG: AI-2E family transporter [Caulobacterales bacterium]
MRAPRLPGSRPTLTGVAGLAAVRAAVIFLAVVVAGALVRVFHEFLAPLVVATFLLLLTDALARTLERRFPRFPGWARGAVAWGLILAGFGAVVGLFVVEGPPFARQLAGIGPRLDEVVGDVMTLLGQPAMSLQDLFAGGDPSHTLTQIAAAARTTLTSPVLVMVYLGFLVASRSAFSAKVDKLYDTDHHRDQARRVLRSIRNAVEQYVRLQTFKALLIAIVAFGVMELMGVKDGLFIAFLVFLAAFVPIVGAFAGALFPALMTLAQFGDLQRPLLILLILGVGVFLIDNVLMPKLQGDELNIDPLLVLISIGFWGFILGAPGVLLSTPLTVTVMAVTAEFDGARWLAILISKDGEPIKDAR